MVEVFATNDPVRLSFAEAVLRQAGVEAVVLDSHTAGLFAGALPWIKRRVLVAEEDEAAARRALAEALPDGDDEA